MKTKLFLFFSALLFSMVLQAQNSISFVNHPTSVVAKSSVTFTVSYTKDAAITNAYALVRFKTPGPNSTNLAQGFTNVTTVNSGTVSVTCVAPDNAGAGYIIEAQLFDARTPTWVTLDTKTQVGITVTEAPLAANYIKILSPPTQVVAGTTIPVTFEYRNSLSTTSYAYLRFRNSSGEFIFDSGLISLTTASPAVVDTKLVNVAIPSNTPAGTTYNFQTIIYKAGDWSGTIANELISNITVLSDPNTVTMASPPNRLITGSTTPIDITYTKDPAIASATVKLLLKNSAGTIVNQASSTVTANSGTVQLSIVAPTAIGTGFTIEAQVVDGTTVKRTDIKTGVSVEEPSPYSLVMANAPTSVVTSSTVDINVNYSKDDAAAFIKVQFTGGDNSMQAALYPLPEKSASNPNANSGTVTLSVETPAAFGTDYSLEATLFNASAVVYKTQIVTGILAESATPNSMTLTNPTMAVTAGQTLSVNFDYTKSAKITKVYAYIFFKGPKQDGSGVGNLAEASMIVPANSGSGTLSLTIPGYASGAGYSYQLQLFNADQPNWTSAYNLDIPNVTVEAYVPTGVNSLEIVNTSSDPINNGDKRMVTVNYNLLQPSIILVEIRDNAGGTGSNKIGQVFKSLPAGNSSVVLELPVNTGHPTASNKIQALMYDPNWAPITIAAIPSMLVAKGDGTITYIGQTSNDYLAEALGNGYYSNYYVATGWKGPLQTKFGPAETPSWIDFTNQNTVADGHKEFDIKIQKFSWHQYKDTTVDHGYPRALNEINYPINTSMQGQWSAGSGGKGQINMTAWLTKTNSMSGDRVDVIVETWSNSGNARLKYDNNTVADGHVFNNLGEIVSDGVTYQVLRTLPGYLGEVASYNLLPDSVVQADPSADYPTAVMNFNVNMKDILEKLIAKEASYSGTKVAINNTWKISGLEWTVVGQSANADAAGTMIASGHGKFTFNTYKIPDLTDVALSTNKFDSKFEKLSIYPNPFTESFTYKVDGELDDSVNVELFSIDGKKIQTIKNDLGNSGTVSPVQLGSGIYFARFTSGNVQETIKVIKK